MGLRICVADTDNDYLRRFVVALEKQQKGDIITVCTSTANLAEVLKEKKFDVLLFSEDIFSSVLPLEHVILPVLFVDETERVHVKFKEYAKVKKYQNVSAIYNQICIQFSEKTSRRTILDGDHAHLVVVYSPLGGSGKSVLALALAERLAMETDGCLYMDFEPFPTAMKYFPTEETGGLSDIFASLSTNIDYGLKVRGLIKRQGALKYIPCFDSPNDLYALRQKEIEDFIQILKEHGQEQWIVIDTDSSIGKSNTTLMNKADHVILIYSPDVSDETRMDVFLEQSWLVDAIDYKMISIRNKCPHVLRTQTVEMGSIANYKGNFNSIVKNVSEDQGMDWLIQKLSGGRN